MKIWVVGRGIPTAYNRMMGSFELGQAKLLAKDHDVSLLAQIFTFSPKNKTPGYCYKQEKDESVSIFSRTIPFLPGRFNVGFDKYRTHMWKTFFDRVEKETGIPDIIHVHYPAMVNGADAVLAYKKKGVKIVCTEHWSKILLHTLSPYETKQLVKYIDGADAIISVGETLRDAIISTTKTSKKVDVIPNVVEPIFFPCNPREKNKNDFRFIFVGRLIKLKQVDKIIEAFASLASVNHNVKLTIVGYGEEYQKLVDLAKKSGVEDSIKFTGTISRTMVAELVKNADCLICYSTAETFGVPVVEAWASGIPVLCSDKLGFARNWDDKLGLIVDSENINDLTDKMNKVMQSHYDASILHEYAQEHYSEEVIISRIKMIYEEICTNGREA